MFKFDETGIYRCVDCGEPYAVGHSVHCKKQPKQSEGGRVNRISNVGKQIEDGMELIHMNEYLRGQ